MKRGAIPAACLLAVVVAASAAAPPMPTFFARRDYAGLYSVWEQVADVNGDGIPDIIANPAGSGNIDVLLGKGDGTFSPGPSTRTVMSAAGVFVATDLLGNGTVDMVLSGEVNLQWGIGVCLGNGDGTFQTGVLYPAGKNSHEDLGAVVVGDFNNDGIPDAVTAGASGVWLFAGKGDGTFNPGVLAVPLMSSIASIAAADLNGDGNLDLVVTLPQAGITLSGLGFVVLFGNGDGTFQAPKHFSTPKQPHSVAIGALLRGGHPSIVLSSSTTGDVYVYIGNGNGGFSPPTAYSLPVATGIAIGDVNGDGIPDLVSAGGYIALGKGNGTFKKPIYYPVQSAYSPANVVLASLRGDSLTDIVTDSSSAISVLLSLGKGKFEDGNWTPVPGGAGCGAAADFNGDGRPDLAVNTANGITILLGTGKSSAPFAPFATGSMIALADAGCLITGDLNNDGIPDLLVPANGTAIAYLGSGDGTFTEKSTTAIPTGGYLVLADFNHDGKLDFATSGNLLALGNGDGTFQTPVPFVPNPPQPGYIAGIAAGDLNGDGWPDVVLTDSFHDFIYILINNQQGGFAQTSFQPPFGGYDPAQILLIDLNADGNLDALTGSTSGGGAIYLGDGKGDLTYQGELSATGIGLQGPLTVADVNGDGIPDIIFEQAGTVAIYLGDGGATFEAPFYIGAGPAPGDILVENLHGQSPTAGIPDVVAPDVSGGVTVLINKTK